MNKKTVKDIEVKGKKVLVRCDFNVPMKDAAITDPPRLIAPSPPTPSPPLSVSFSSPKNITKNPRGFHSSGIFISLN